ncbi:MAG: WYL domain-containing protein [Clostridia bacterium]|nr:WYL domain-containing protein [Clostridia bacterium]
MPVPELSRTIRINKIIDLLNRTSPYGGLTTKELATKCGASERQIYRDLRTIEDDLRIILEKETGGGQTRYRLADTFLPPLSPEQALIIFLSLIQQKGSALGGHINDIKDILVTHLFKYKYSPDRLPLEEMQQRIYIVEEMLSNPQEVSEHFGKIINALVDNHKIKIYYYVTYRGQYSERVVEPYGLICKRHNWYLVGYCNSSMAVRTFRVDQIESIMALTTEKFTYPQDFSLEEYLGKAWGVTNDGQITKVKLKFSPEVAHRVKNMIYHPSQQIETITADGSVIICFEVAGIIELQGWIMEWADNVEVLEPESLRQEIKAVAARIAALY